MPKDFYKKSTQFPKPTVNTNIPTADHTPSNVRKVGDAVTTTGRAIPEQNCQMPSPGQGKTGCFGKDAG